MSDKLIEFIQEFFKGLNSSLSFDGKLMKIEKIPVDFQNFYGKKEPYYFAFDENQNPESVTEVVKPSGYILGCIKEYLKTKGQTSLVNLIFDLNPKEAIDKAFAIRNCELSNLTKKQITDFMIRFVFQATFQYQNQREQENHALSVYKNQLVNFNLDDYKYEEGKNSSLVLPSLRKDYDLVKNEIKQIIKPKIESLGLELDKKLEKELKRINEHFANQLKETEVKIKNLENEIARLEKLKDSEEINKQKLAKVKNTLLELKAGEFLEKIKKEQQFFVNDEKNKHALNVSTKLLNTTIISYPLFSFTGYLKNKDTARVLELTYNPLTESMQGLNCDCCKNPIKILNLCGSGHLVCDKCLRGCSECGKDYCPNCLTKSCFSCGKKLCRKCIKRCSKCLKDKCSAHMSRAGICISCEEKSSKSRISFY